MPSLMTLQGPSLGALAARTRIGDCECCPNCACENDCCCEGATGRAFAKTPQGRIYLARKFRRSFRSSTAMRGLAGITDTLKARPWVLLGGLILGGFLARKKINPFAAIWGDSRASQLKTKALTGRRRR